MQFSVGYKLATAGLVIKLFLELYIKLVVEQLVSLKFAIGALL